MIRALVSVTVMAAAAFVAARLLDDSHAAILALGFGAGYAAADWRRKS